jgi:hypothetical protein
MDIHGLLQGLLYFLYLWVVRLVLEVHSREWCGNWVLLPPFVFESLRWCTIRYPLRALGKPLSNLTHKTRINVSTSQFFNGWADRALKKSIDFDECPDPNSIRMRTLCFQLQWVQICMHLSLSTELRSQREKQLCVFGYCVSTLIGCKLWQEQDVSQWTLADRDAFMKI